MMGLKKYVCGGAENNSTKAFICPIAKDGVPNSDYSLWLSSKLFVCHGCNLRNSTKDVSCNGMDPDRSERFATVRRSDTSLGTIWSSIIDNTPCTPERNK